MGHFPPLPRYVVKICGSLLSKQLVRANGLRGLLTSILGESNNEDNPSIERMEQIAHITTHVPVGMTASVSLRVLISVSTSLTEFRSNTLTS